MSSTQKVRDKIKMLKAGILARKLEKIRGYNYSKKLRGKLNGLIKVKNSWKKPYHINSINNSINNYISVRVPRILAKNNVGKNKKVKGFKRVTFKNNFNFSNSPLNGSPLYEPSKTKTPVSKKESRKQIKEFKSFRTNRT
jgi:hypothetical protein